MSRATAIVDKLLETEDFSARDYLMSEPRQMYVVRHPGFGGLYWSTRDSWSTILNAKQMTEEEANNFIAPYAANGYRLEIEPAQRNVREADDFNAREYFLTPVSLPGKRIRISYSTTTPESVEMGDTADHGWIDEEGEEMDVDPRWDDEGMTPARKAADFLNKKGAYHPSSSHFHPGIWYSDDPQITDYGTGEEEERHYHLTGFTPEEEQFIFNEVAMKI